MVPLSRERPAGREAAGAASNNNSRLHHNESMAIHVALHHQNRIPVRPAGIARTSYRQAAPRPALPHADPLIFAESSSQEPLHQLATGPAKQLSRAAGLPRANHGAIRGSRSGCRNGGIQSVRLLPGAPRGTISLFLRPLGRPRVAPISRNRAGRSRAFCFSRQSAARDPGARWIFWSASIKWCRTKSATSFAWSRACRLARRPSLCAPAPAAIQPGCWSRSCATSDWRRASFPVI